MKKTTKWLINKKNFRTSFGAVLDSMELKQYKKAQEEYTKLQNIYKRPPKIIIIIKRKPTLYIHKKVKELVKNNLIKISKNSIETFKNNYKSAKNIQKTLKTTMTN